MAEIRLALTASVEQDEDVEVFLADEAGDLIEPVYTFGGTRAEYVISSGASYQAHVLITEPAEGQITSSGWTGDCRLNGMFTVDYEASNYLNAQYECDIDISTLPVDGEPGTPGPPGPPGPPGASCTSVGLVFNERLIARAGGLSHTIGAWITLPPHFELSGLYQLLAVTSDEAGTASQEQLFEVAVFDLELLSGAVVTTGLTSDVPDDGSSRAFVVSDLGTYDFTENPPVRVRVRMPEIAVDEATQSVYVNDLRFICK